MCCNKPVLSLKLREQRWQSPAATFPLMQQSVTWIFVSHLFSLGLLCFMFPNSNIYKWTLLRERWTQFVGKLFIAGGCAAAKKNKSFWFITKKAHTQYDACWCCAEWRQPLKCRIARICWLAPFCHITICSCFWNDFFNYVLCPRGSNPYSPSLAAV